MRPLRPVAAASLLWLVACDASDPEAPATYVLVDDAEPLPVTAALVDAANAGVIDVPAPTRGDWKVLFLRRDAGMAVAPDGHRLAIVRDRPAVLSVDTGKVLAELAGGDGCVLPAWSGDGDTLAVWCPATPTGEVAPDFERSGSDAHQLVFWAPASGERRVIGELPVDTAALAWVPSRSAWWATAVGRRGILGTLIGEDGTSTDVFLPEGFEEVPDRSSTVSWSLDGRVGRWSGGVLKLPRYIDGIGWIENPLIDGRDGFESSVPLVWEGGRLVRAGPTSAAEGDLPGGRTWSRSGGEDQLLGPRGEVLWTGHVAGLVVDVYRATGRCPVLPDGSERYGGREMSPDGRWGVNLDAIEHVADGTRMSLPGERQLPPVDFHAEVRPGGWLLTMGGSPYVLDTAVGRFTWALDGGRVLAVEGARALVYSRDRGPLGTLLRIDFAAERAWRMPVHGAHADGAAVWARDLRGSLLRIRPDGRLTHRVDVPEGFGTGMVMGTPVETRSGWVAWPYGSGLVAVFRGDAASVHVVVPEVGWAGVIDDVGGGMHPSRWPESVAWLVDDGLHVLDDQGHEHRLSWRDARVHVDGGEPTTPSQPQVLGWLRELRAGEVHPVAFPEDAALDLWLGNRRGGGPAFWLNWNLPHALVRSQTAGPDADTTGTAAHPDFRTLDDGWVLLRADGSASGRDRLGAVVLDDGSGAVRPTPLFAPREPWRAPSRVTWGPCPWDAGR